MFPRDPKRITPQMHLDVAEEIKQHYFIFMDMNLAIIVFKSLFERESMTFLRIPVE